MRFHDTQTYIRFRAGWNAQGLDRNLLPFKSSFQPYAAWYGIVTISVILLFSGFSVFLRGNWDTADFVTNYIPLMFAPILFAVASYVMKSKFVKPEDMDFVTGIDEIIADTYDEPPPKNIWEKFWLWIVSALNLPLSHCSRSAYSPAFTVLDSHGLNKQWSI
jgi:amino acid transporter